MDAWFQVRSLSRRRDLAHITLPSPCALYRTESTPLSLQWLQRRTMDVEYSFTLWESCTKADKGMLAGYDVICPRYSPGVLLAAGALDALTRTPNGAGLWFIAIELLLSIQSHYRPFLFGATRLPAPPCLLRSRRYDHAALVPIAPSRIRRVALLVLLSATELPNRK
jgi:hypothetical protein